MVNSLRRVLNLPLLVFYGLGVTVGAGIFALIGEIVHLAGDQAPLAFLLAGMVAGATGFSYALLVVQYPRAAGEAVFVKMGLNAWAGRLVGLGVAVTAIVSSAVISIAFAGYLATLVNLPHMLLVLGLLLTLAAVACWGVRQSVLFAAAITVLELGTLVMLALSGSPLLLEPAVWVKVSTLPVNALAWTGVLSASVIAFFAFIGFEDLVNMAEETVSPQTVMPKAIAWTLLITILLYVLIAAIAVALPERQALTNSNAPLAVLFEAVTGLSGRPIAAIASIAMVNGVLIQIVMASRVIYGMANEGLLPAWLGQVQANRQTPMRAIGLTTACIAALALGFPLLQLAQATSLVTLAVFTAVNLALWRLGSHPNAPVTLRRWRLWGLVAAAMPAGLFISELWLQLA